MHSTRYGSALLLGLALSLFVTSAHAIINQVDGTIVPVGATLQSCLDKATTAIPPGEGPGVLDAVRNAAIRPQTFLPNAGGATPFQVTFFDVGEGAGYQNRFGWYHVGTTPFAAANRHEVFNCRNTTICACPCNAGARIATGPARSCMTWLNNNTVRLDFACLRALPVTNPDRWNGGPIAFYLLTPELLAGGSSAGSCAAVDSTVNRVYSTDSTVNDDGDYVHFLIYESRTYAQSYYFGFEDLFRGGDNDFEDMLVRANGLVPSCNPQPEICNNLDDDCDGIVDNFTRPCSTACGTGTQRCTTGTFGLCSARVPGAEICNGLDDDCDGETDEGLTMACSNACGPGVRYCAAGVFGGCVPTRTPTGEVCNNIDDNCDGMIDEGLTRPCSSVCGMGVERCITGAYGMCTAPSPATEVCDGLDNNCNGVVDDGVASRACMSACGPGTATCVGGRFVCNAPLPQPEVCDGRDNDCDGMTDEGVPAGGTCGRSVGACRAGMFVCEGGMYVCRGATSGTAETCNNIDDDCNGVVDDGIPPGGSCMMSGGTPLCTPGQLRCRAGMTVCEGGTRGTTEICDCMDNDCNGRIDDDPVGGAICPGGAACIACSCRTPCRPDNEFPCSTGLICRDGFCVPPICGSRVCAEGETCVNNACVDPCVSITCAMGEVCQRGRCIENSCYVLGCPNPAEVCVNATCQPDRCRDVTCATGEFCREGTCIRSCANVRCTVGQSCRDGACIDDPCATVRCAAGQVCEVQDDTRGTCVDNMCQNVGCPAGRRCDHGMCVDDPCARVQCNAGNDVVCRNGQCELRNPPPNLNRDRGIATGGGGFTCNASPASSGSASGNGAGYLALLLAMVAVRLGRRHRIKLVHVGAMAMLGAGASACRSEPYCFNCVDGSTAIDDRGVNIVDAIPNDGCVNTGPELCDGLDNNCDGTIDEGFDLQTDPAHCGMCSTRCDVPHAIPGCREGACTIGTCDIGWYDLDRNPLNGCEYGCTPTGDEVCDNMDNNCNGLRDEGLDLQTDRNNCGRCANVCRFDHAAGTCSMGMCVAGACDPGFVDANRNPADGCEYACEASGPEVCDGRDNNCNGTVDDGINIMTDPRNCGACGRVCVLPNGTPGCVAGVCTVVTCNTGFADDPRTPARDCSLACGNAAGMRGPELCDGLDNDCNGLIDDGGVAMVGTMCGATNVGACEFGRNVCDRGVLRCVGGVTAASEICDGLDNDCDGVIDELPLPGVGATFLCGTNVGACSFGALACAGGAVVCQGGVRAGTAETCNGLDDDCDGQVDEATSPPATLRCNLRGTETQGVCVNVTRTCGGAGGFRCNYPATYRNLTNEALCDGLDNNCDGRVDEGCLTLGTERRLDQGAANSIQPVITGAAGALGVVYLDQRDGNADIFFNRSTDNGLTWLADLRIDRDPGTSNQVQPWVAGTGSSFYSAWGDFRLSGGATRQVFANRSTNLGATWAATDVNAASSTTDAFNTRVVASGTNVTVVFEALFSDRSRHIDVAVSRDSGATWPTFARVDHGPGTAVASTPAVAMGAPGEIYVVWRDNRNGQTDIYFNRSLDYGTTFLAADVRMDTDAAGARASVSPSVAADTMSNVFVAWSDNQVTATRFDIFSRTSSNRGTSFNAVNVRVDADPIPHDSDSPIALAVNGSFAAVWLDDRHGRTSVYASRSTDGGLTWPTSDVRVQTNLAGISNASSLTAATSNGVVFVGWADDRDPSATSPLDIRGNYSLDGGGGFQPADIRIDGAAAGIDSETPFVYSAGGIGHYVWVDRRANGIVGDIFYRALR